MEKRTRSPMRASGLNRSIIAGLTIVLLGTETALGAPPTPLTICGQHLDVAGAHYVLTGDLTCPDTTAVIISANDVRFSLSGFTLSGDGTGASGIEVDSVSGVRIRGGAVMGFGNGIRLSIATNVRVSDMVLTGNGDGVQLQSSDNNRISDSTITGNTIGVELEGSDNNTVSANTVSNNVADPAITVSAGVFVQNGSTGNVIASNIIASNGTVGVTLQSSDSNLVEGNTVTDTFDDSPRPGITVVGSSLTRVRGNTVSGNSFGIELAPGLGSATGNLVQGNTSNGNDQGILVLDGATSNTIRLNTATGNFVVDLNDANSGCDANTWTSNTFATDLVAGVAEGGPGVGCIQ